jgi:hypothetical protein
VKIALALGMIFSVSALAAQPSNEAFLADSAVPAFLQVQVLAAAQSACPSIAQNGLTEVSTVRVLGQTELDSDNAYYVTEFSSHYSYFGNFYSGYQSVEVKSMESGPLQAANGTAFEVLEVRCSP